MIRHFGRSTVKTRISEADWVTCIEYRLLCPLSIRRNDI